MNPQVVSSYFRPRTFSLAMGMMLAALQGGAFAQDAAQTQTDAGIKSAPTAEKVPGTDQAPANPAAKALAEVLRLVDAGVSNDIIRTFVESSSTGYDLTAADIIALKQRGVADGITTAMLKRGAELRAQAARVSAQYTVGQEGRSTAQNVATLAPGLAHPQYAGIDPDSYNYFWYYHLYPRTLAAANQRLGLYGAPYSFGYDRPWLGGPFSPGPYPYFRPPMAR